MKITDKIIEYGLYLFIFLLPVQTRWIIKAGELNNSYFEYSTYSLYLTDILLFLLLLFFGWQKIRSPGKPSGKKIYFYWWIVAGLELAVFISIFFASNKSLAFYGYFRFLLGVGVFWLLAAASYNQIKLIYSFLAGLILQANLGGWQFLSQNSFASKWLGLARHLPEDLGASVVETLSGQRWLRAYGSLDHPNILGAILAIGIFAVFILLKKSNPIKRIFIYFTLALFFSVLFFAFSRGAWTGLIVGFLVILVLNLFQKNTEDLKQTLKIILLTITMAVVLFSQYSQLVLTRLSQDTRLENKSNTERVVSYKESSKIIKENILFGQGVGNYTTALYKIDKQQLSWHYQPVHNTFLLVWSEIGIIGLFFFLWLFAYLILALFKQRTKNKSYPQNIVKIAILISSLTMMMVDHWWWSLHFGIFFLWMVFGICARQINENNRDIIR